MTEEKQKDFRHKHLQILEAPNYFVFGDGGIFSGKRRKFLTPHKVSGGYLSACLYNNGTQIHRLIHRLVAIAFIPNPENKPQVNHINSIKTDNRVQNLEWATCSENHLHAYQNGKKGMKGEKSPMSKLTEGKVLAIKLAIKDGVRNNHLANKYNVSQQIICDIKKGRRWSHVVV